jgi:hypothetical protein
MEPLDLLDGPGHRVLLEHRDRLDHRDLKELLVAWDPQDPVELLGQPVALDLLVSPVALGNLVQAGLQENPDSKDSQVSLDKLGNQDSRVQLGQRVNRALRGLVVRPETLEQQDSWDKRDLRALLGLRA